jgi:hypothetical protein
MTYYGEKYGYSIDKVNRGTLLVPDRWTTTEAVSNTIVFLKKIVPDWVGTFEELPQQQVTEAEVEPILFEIIKPFVQLSSLKVICLHFIVFYMMRFFYFILL